ncbi:MAG TPA: AtpZ/AtpI family protein [Planctomicrobium sp.]|nr:AtpZ/AtpI family protein [Planctomicrobium sp.]
MANRPSKNHSDPASRQNPFSRQVSDREARKVRAGRNKDRTLWVGLGAFGAVGWSIAVPTLIGVMVGVWADRNWPSTFSWTLALLLAGVSLGCMSAWVWISKERKSIDEERDEHS